MRWIIGRRCSKGFYAGSRNQVALILHRFRTINWKIAGSIRTICLVLTCLVVLPLAASADTWFPPTVQTYLSPDNQTRFTVIPRGIESPLAYFDGLVRGDDNAGQQPSGAPFARGILERETGDGTWTTLWDKRLVNNVSPVSALVADSSRYVVTFDNWASMGWGNDVIVIYGADGTLIRSLSLNDVLPEDYVRALPRSLSSLWWSGAHSIEASDDVLILKVVTPGERYSRGADGRIILRERRFVDVPVDLASGNVMPITDAGWQEALVEAEKIAEQQEISHERYCAWFNRPLVRPPDTESNGLEQYLTEAYFRLDPDWQSSPLQLPLSVILPAPDDRRYDTQV